MPVRRFVFLLLFVATAATAAASPDAAAPHVRSSDPIVHLALGRGLARSATFRRLIEELERSDVIVHVMRDHGEPRRSGFTQFIAATEHVRYLRITLAVADASDATVALLGHELRHVLEAAVAPDVLDEASYYALYRRIGRAVCPPPRWCFDTAAAVQAGLQVHTELRGNRDSARLSTAKHHERRSDE